MILIVQERNMQRIWDTIKRPTLQIIARIEGEKSQVKDRDKIFHKIVEENNLKWKKKRHIYIATRSTENPN